MPRRIAGGRTQHSRSLEQYGCATQFVHKIKHMSSLEYLLELFPEINLPITLTEESAHIFSQTNGLIADDLLERYILPHEDEMADEFTEFVPCFRIPATHDFHALVFWRAGLMKYTFTMLTLDKQGQRIDRRELAGTFSTEDLLIQSVATIDEDWEILVVAGQSRQGSTYDASASQKQTLELLPEGQIIQLS